ncbi:MAG: RnfABCDGE type electron transport complex subunit D [Oscillospiraceae bacterium]|nr:RnfABCDGE type electron transport complex subunit D [Oscillospiraceae bacterium]
MSGRKDIAGSAVLAVSLMAADGAAVYCYGLRALIVVVICAGVCVLCDMICTVARRRHLDLSDLSSLTTGLALAAMFPASVPYWVCVMSCVFAVCVVKHPLGGLVPPAAAGYIFAELSFPAGVLRYPRMGILAIGNITDGLYRLSDMNVFSDNSPYSDFEMMIGRIPGPMACGFVVLHVICALVLVYSHKSSLTVFLMPVVTTVLWCGVFDGADRARAALFGGMLVFCSAYISSAVGYVPEKKASRVIYAVFLSAVTIAVTEISAVESPAVYACVLCAPFRTLEKITSGGDDLRTEQKAKS